MRVFGVTSVGRLPNPEGLSAFYESDVAVEFFIKRYHLEKERAFCEFLTTLIPPGAKVLEIGGGAGLHGCYLAESRSVIHSDASKAMVDSARRFGLESLQLDAMDLSSAPAADILLAIELSTLRSEHSEMRRGQIRAFAAAIQPGQTIILSNAREPGRTMGRNEQRMMREAGFEPKVTRYWGIVPARFWFRGAAKLEHLLSCLPLGVRKVQVWEKRVMAARS